MSIRSVQRDLDQFTAQLDSARSPGEILRISYQVITLSSRLDRLISSEFRNARSNSYTHSHSRLNALEHRIYERRTILSLTHNIEQL